MVGWVVAGLVVISGLMAAGAALHAYWQALLGTACVSPSPRPPTLLERAQKRFGLKIYSQWNEETLIRHFFNDERDGFFVDIGAADCCSISTTYYLESHLGWAGIAVDANASYREGYEKRRPKSAFLSYFVSDTSDVPADFFLVPGAPGISSGKRSHLDKFPFVAGQHMEVDEKKIPTITLNKLLGARRVKSIDFLSIDIEGAELSALHGFDIDTYKPRLVCVEVQKELGDALLQYFHDHRYRRIDEYLPFDRYNWYFAPLTPS
jgi:FkbM family methyltransferase